MRSRHAAASARTHHLAAPLHLVADIAGQHHRHRQDVAQRQQPDRRRREAACATSASVDRSAARSAARAAQAARNSASAQVAPPGAATASTAQASGYCMRRQRELRAAPATGWCAPSAVRGGTGRAAASPAPSSPARWRPGARQPLRAHQPAQHVVVGQMVDQRREPADRGQRLAAQRHRGAEAVLPAERAGHQRAGQEAVGDRGRRPARAASEPVGRQPGVERGDQPGARARPARPRSARDSPARTCMSLSAITSTSCRAAGSMLIRLPTLRLAPCGGGSTTSAMSRSGKRARSRSTTAMRRIGRVLHAEHDLERRVVLRADAGQRRFEQRLVAAERLEDGDRRALASCGGRECRRGSGERPDSRRPPARCRRRRCSAATPAIRSSNGGTGAEPMLCCRPRGRRPCCAAWRSAAQRRRLASSERKSERCTATRLIEPSSSTSTALPAAAARRIT